MGQIFQTQAYSRLGYDSKCELLGIGRAHCRTNGDESLESYWLTMSSSYFICSTSCLRRNIRE